ncbi:MAG: flagellar hook-basal body complex protein FliE [Schwartzia sp.]|nr:flagellar hook-basal body complex protein FliE [Schwartzia sp. (in: firmicutes)]
MEIEPLQMTPVRSVKMSAESHLGETLPESEVKSFGELLTDALKETNALENKATALNAALAAGEIDDVSQVVIASQKADIALNLILQVRNRAISAYQELMRMQV